MNPMTEHDVSFLPLRAEPFTQRVLTWFDQHGRKYLPWQQERSLYRVWVSEIMLQQTQVTTVIPYYQRFMGRFPDLLSLAAAAQDEVLHYWSGLGYYARARHLHKAAQFVRDHHGGQFPSVFEDVIALPGIGRSTAGAILALAADQRHPILDGNVKRLLARFAAIAGWSGDTQTSQQLWAVADYYTPSVRVADYTQAMMDLGALVCRRTRPKCSACPLSASCIAHGLGRQQAYPEPRPSRNKPVRAVRMLILNARDNQVLLEKRPPTGVWGGLWGLPECPLDVDLVDWCEQRFDLNSSDYQTWPVVRHSFSHFHLDIHPVRIDVNIPNGNRLMEAERFVWYNIDQPKALGLAAPVQRLLDQLVKSD